MHSSTCLYGSGFTDNADTVDSFWITVLLYLFGRVGRLGEDGLPVRPYKQDEREVEEDQVDNWREKLIVRINSILSLIRASTLNKQITIRVETQKCCC